MSNTATGRGALQLNTASFNTAIGDLALASNFLGTSNTAVGSKALEFNTTGIANIALGDGAGSGVSMADAVICIGASGANVSNSCYIGQIFGATSSGGTAVFINSDGKLGTSTSSLRFKDDIKPMDKASGTLFSLKPVTFHYKKEIDPAGTSQFGLVAEEVEKVNPDLVVRDKNGEIYTVRYDAVNAMLLNEFLKEHRKVDQQQATIAELQSTVAQQQKGFESRLTKQEKQIEGLASGLQKVSAQLAAASPSAGGLEVSGPRPQVVVNGP